MLALVLARGEDELAGDLRDSDALGAQGTGVVGHIVVGDLEAPSVTATLAGGRLAFQGLFPDVLALGLGHAGEEREQGGAVPGRVVDPLEGAGEEFGSMSW
ncbi:hypothetical protein OH781_41050 [Streptomyces sp. NBC_01550]|uniref:hypothetical protein n=1 Tax=Streptomyces sp. NBC_01550 TaxID=2975875 RepID=UPI003866244D